jgi:ABC-type cobalamin/Fe3+-siderophores transport system ATPase subunit
MLVKSTIGEPIVIMGESGCGKTYFTKFTASCIQKDEIRVLTLHAGVKERQLLAFLKECIKRAKQFKDEGNGKKLWILFDEFNTSALQSIVTEIMQDKICSIDEEITYIPDNMVFVAACNPFQLREKKSQLGLIPDTAENRLSHKVYIVLESLLNYVWDFGQLTPEDEKDHIFSIIDSEEIFKNKKGKLDKDAKEGINFLKTCVYEGITKSGQE